MLSLNLIYSYDFNNHQLTDDSQIAFISSLDLSRKDQMCVYNCLLGLST